MPLRADGGVTMAKITLEKTWQRQRGEINHPGFNTYEWALAAIKMKDLMVASGHWTVTQSSDGVIAGAADHWTTYTSIVAAADGVAHSWIVLRNPAIAMDFEVCINFNGTTRIYSSVYCTHQGFNLDGTVTTRPTAVGSEMLVTDKQAYALSPPANWRVLVLTSSDGQCTRVIFSSALLASGVSGGWHFERLKHAPSWMTQPYIVMAVPCYGSGDYAGLSSVIPRYTIYCHATLGVARCYHGTIIKSTFASIGVAAALGMTPIGRIPRADNGAYPVYPVYVVSQTSAVPGFLGEMYDLYWLPNAFGDDIVYNPVTRLACPLIYLPTVDSDMGLFGWGVWAFGDTGEGGLF
jgi:hypothetical protein